MSFRRQTDARAHSLFLKLESRLVFDAAAGGTVAAAVDDSSDSGTSLNPDAVSLPPLTDGDAVADPALKEVAFVDAGLTDAAELVAGIREGVEVVMLGTGCDGLLQITDWLASHGGIDAVHIYSHGSEGQIQLGAIELTASNVDQYSPMLSSWRDLLSQNADILIYGCNVGAGNGVMLTETLALYTGADVAASTDLTGSSTLGGNWTLEQTVGTIDVTNALTELEQQQYAYILPPSPPAETWTISNQTVSEGGLITFTLTRANGSGAVNVNWATSTGTASATDFTSGSGTLAFSGNESKTFTVQTTQDAIYEANENFTVTVTGLTGATASKSATGTISNDDAAPTFNIAAASGNEGNAITFTVTRSGDSEISQVVNYSTAGGTAVSDTDFTAATGTLTFDGLSGNTKTFSVQTTGDGIFEASETFTAGISWGSGGGAGSASATGTIVNADAAPVFSITPSASGNEGGTITFTVTMDRAASMAQTVDYAVAFGTASAGDFVTSGGGAGDPLSGTLSFAAGQTSKTITLKAATDAIYEGAETFSVALSSPAGGSTVGTSGTGAGSIINTTSAPVFTIAPTVETTAEGGMLTYTVTMDRVSTFEQSVDWSVSLADKTASLSDFDATTYPLSGRLVFAAGVTSQTFTIATFDDAMDEASPETFTVALANPLGGAVLGSASSSAGSITDNDVPTFSIVQRDPLQTDVIEGQSYDFNVSVVSGAANTSYVLTYDISGRVSLADFSGISSLSGNTVTIITDAGGVGTTAVRLQTATDSAGEKTEALSVTLKDGNSRVGQLDTVVIDPKVTISSPTSATSSETEDVSAQQAFSFTLSVTGADSTDYQVQFRVDGSGGAPATTNDYRVLVGGNELTAVDGIYTVTVSTSSRGAGALDVRVAPVDDALDEPDETLTISLVESLGLNLTGNTTKTLTILDNDVPTFSVAQDAPATVSEGDTYDFTVSVASGAANTTYRLNYTLSGSGIQAADFISGSLTGWVDVTTDANGVGSATVNLGIARDADVSKERLAVTLDGGTVSGQSVGEVNARQASISTEIVEPVVTISRPNADTSSIGENVAENQAYQFTIAVADGARNGSYTVSFRLDGAVINGASSDDYRVVDANGNTLTADADGVYTVTVSAGRNGEGSVNVTVIPVDDAVDERDETVTIGLVQEGTDPSLDGSTSRVLTIIDDDIPEFSVGAALGVEGGGLYVDIVSSMESTSDLEVDFIIVFDGSAQPDDVSIDPSLIAVDRNGNPTSVDDVNFFGFQGTARIASGDTSVALRIGSTLADGDARESFSVFLSNARKVGATGDEVPTIEAGLDVADHNAEGFSGQIFGRAIDYVVSSMTFLEDGTGAEFTITRYGDLAERTYDWDVVLNGTADAADFDGGAAPSGSVTFAAGQDTAKVTLAISRDTNTEAVAETFSLRLSSPGYGWPSSFDQNYLDSLSARALNDLGKLYDAENQVFFTLDPINQGTTNPSNSDKGEIEISVTEQLAGTWIDPSGSELTLYLDYQKASFVNNGLIDEADLLLADSHIEADVAVKLYVNGLEFDVVLAGDGNDWTYDPNYRFDLNGNQTGAGIFKVTVDFSQIRLAADPSVTLAGLLDTASMEAGDSWRIKFIDTTNGNRVFEQAGAGYNQQDAGPDENGSWQARYAAVAFNFAGGNSAAVGNIIDDDFGLDLKPYSPPSLVMNMPMDVGSMTFDLSPMFEATPAPISDLGKEPTAEGTIIAPGLVNGGTADIGSYVSRNPNLVAAVAGSETVAGRGMANGLQGMADTLLINALGGDPARFQGQGNAFGIGGAETGATQEGGAVGNDQQPPADNDFQPQAASDHQAGDSYAGLPDWLLSGDFQAAFTATDAVVRGQEAGLQLALLKERNRFNLETAALYRMVQEQQVAQEAGV